MGQHRLIPTPYMNLRKLDLEAQTRANTSVASFLVHLIWEIDQAMC